MVGQQVQTQLPMFMHPNPKDVFYLGLGTGITAGTALRFDVDKVVISELSPSAIKASEEFFTDYTNGLYEDPRVTVIAEDGRNVLRGTRDTFDLIISDLFIPWKAGTGTLYSVEHYETSLRRLNTGGMYAQWLPLYQLTREEFAIIARSMLEVFPMVTLWRGNFKAGRPVAALIGHQDATPIKSDSPILDLSRAALGEWSSGNGDQVPFMAHYVGSLKAEDIHITKAPLNTDNYPVIEYLAPINHRLEKAGQAQWFVNGQLLEFMAPYLHDDVLTADPYLSSINPRWQSVMQAGYYLQASNLLRKNKHKDAPKVKATYKAMFKKAASAK